MANPGTTSVPQSPQASSLGAADFHEEMVIARDIVEYLKEYAREKPEVAAIWCFSIGFILGWKLKPW